MYVTVEAGPNLQVHDQTTILDCCRSSVFFEQIKWKSKNIEYKL